MKGLPPSLSRIRSQFKILCDDFGGPVPLIDATDQNELRKALEHACSEFSFRDCWTTFRDWEQDKARAMQHWPWVAFAASQYRFEREIKEKYKEEPTPTEIKALVRSIAKNARELCQNLTRLQELSYNSAIRRRLTDDPI